MDVEHATMESVTLYLVQTFKLPVSLTLPQPIADGVVAQFDRAPPGERRAGHAIEAQIK